MTTNTPATPSSSSRRWLLGSMALLAAAGGGLAGGLGLLPGPGAPAFAADPAPTTAASLPRPDAAASAPTTQPDKPKRKKKQQLKMDETEAFFEAGTIPQIRVELAKEDVDKLRNNSRGDVGGTVRETVAGKQTVYKDVAIHLKGSAGSVRGVDDKPGMTLSFDEFDEKQRFHGLEKLNLNNGAQDATYMVENLGNALFRDAGVAGCRCTNARVWLNGRDFGVYVLKEGFADTFLKRYFNDPTGTLYEGGFVKDINEGLSERTNKNNRDLDKIKELIAAAQDGDATRRRARLEKVVDVNRFHTFMAMEALTAHWDGYCGNRNNYRVYDDPEVRKVVFVPHGMDQLFQQPDYPIQPTGSLLSRALTESPADRARYIDRVIELREKVMTPDNLNKHIDRISGFLAPLMKDVGADAAKQHAQNTKELRSRVLERVKAVDRQLAAIPRPLKFDAQGYTALSSTRWEEKNEGGNVKVERVTEGGKELIRLKAANGGGGITFRQPINLPQGKYTFEAQTKLAGVTLADGTPNAGVGLRIGGVKRENKLKGTADWTKATYDIDVAEGSRDVVLVVEFRATAGEAWFDVGSIKLRKR